MGHKYDATITVKDTMNIPAVIQIKEIPAAGSPDMTKLGALATSLKSHMNGGIAAYALLDWEDTAVTDVSTPVGVNSDKALILYQWFDADDIQQYGRLILPNPRVGLHFEAVEGEGYRMLAASKTTLEGILSAASGLAITVSEGKLIHQSGKKSKSHTSIGFIDELVSTAWMQFPLVTDTAALGTMAGALVNGNFSGSKITTASSLTKTEVLPDQSAGIGLAAVDGDDPKFTTVETRAILKFRYRDGTVKKYMNCLLPSVERTVCELTGKKKDSWKVKKAVADGIALSLTALFGSGNKAVYYESCKMKVKNIRSM
jgi:hypothetical protein